MLRSNFVSRIIKLNSRLYSEEANTNLQERIAQYKEKIRKNDRVLKTFTRNARISLLTNTNTASVAKDKHNLSEVCTRFLGQALSSSSLLASFLKGDERVILEWCGDGVLKSIYAEATRSGEVRGYLSVPDLKMPVNVPLAYATGAGTLRVSNILYNNSTPYTSTVRLSGTSVASDLEMYFTNVEQVPTYLDLETNIGKNGEVVFSGGILIQPLPQETHEESHQIIANYRNHLKRKPPLSVMFDEGLQLLDILRVVSMHPEDIKEENIEKHRVDFYCRCSKDRFKEQIVALSKQSFQMYKDLAHQNGVHEDLTITCQFCNSDYTLTPKDFEELEISNQYRLNENK
eukprot:TRINITY_DN11150_c0_g1_i1.p1 TRINITY_DN11150_c0_g1~~TRINITY_DN11150_c0_g1_i1.p1  ORF type:complete len:345 (-),score=23.24 TRINITY_DN11150_c0_g1_i1:19-1053(-)